MNFSKALEYLKSGCMVSKKEWINEGLFLKFEENGQNKRTIYLYKFDDDMTCGGSEWKITQDDILSNDWISRFDKDINYMPGFKEFLKDIYNEEVTYIETI